MQRYSEAKRLGNQQMIDEVLRNLERTALAGVRKKDSYLNRLISIHLLNDNYPEIFRLMGLMNSQHYKDRSVQSMIYRHLNNQRYDEAEKLIDMVSLDAKAGMYSAIARRYKQAGGMDSKYIQLMTLSNYYASKKYFTLTRGYIASEFRNRRHASRNVGEMVRDPLFASIGAVAAITAGLAIRRFVF
jgi:hypothetical protein